MSETHFLLEDTETFGTVHLNHSASTFLLIMDSISPIR
jgi:hypothetical protein